MPETLYWCYGHEEGDQIEVVIVKHKECVYFLIIS
jgi:hypothetical protein